MKNSGKLKHLIEAEHKAKILFDLIFDRGLLVAGKTEKELNNEVFALAQEVLGIRKFWHKRIVRAGKNTLLPYRENPPDLILQKNDIVFFDLGPVFEEWEADIGKTFVLGEDQTMKKMQADTELAWKEGNAYYQQLRDTITGAQLYSFTCDLARRYEWEYGNEHCGHLVGNFPHEQLLGEERINYIHPENHQRMSDPDKNGEERFWIYEIHFIDKQKQIGGFFEKLMCKTEN